MIWWTLTLFRPANFYTLLRLPVYICRHSFKSCLYASFLFVFLFSGLQSLKIEEYNWFQEKNQYNDYVSSISNNNKHYINYIFSWELEPQSDIKNFCSLLMFNRHLDTCVAFIYDIVCIFGTCQLSKCENEGFQLVHDDSQIGSILQVDDKSPSGKHNYEVMMRC